MIPWPTVAQSLELPSAVVTKSLSLEHQAGAMPGAPKASVSAKAEFKCNSRYVETGGAGTIDESIKATAIGGSISLVGLLTGAGGRLDMLPILANILRIHGVVVGSVEMFERMIGMIEHLGIRPVIDAAFDIQDIAAALEYLRSGRHLGKVIIKV